MDPNKPKSGIKKPSGIPSMGSRLPAPTSTRKSTGIPSVSSASNLSAATGKSSRPVTPTPGSEDKMLPPKTIPKPSSSSNIRSSLLPTSVI